MNEAVLELLRCPFCGTRLSIVENDALVRVGARIESGVIGCECCAFPIVAGIPVMIADDQTRDAMHALEAGRREEALFALLGLDEARGAAFRALLAPGAAATYRDALEILSLDAEGTCFLYRFSDPTFMMAEGLLQALGQDARCVEGRLLDLCGGSGHLTRVLSSLRPTGGTFLADVFFWKLWLAARFTSPGCTPVCCDANLPLPFVPGTFSMVLLADAFPYLWHKRLATEEMMRLAGPDGVVVMPHLHSALGDNFSAGNTLTPEAYRDLLGPLHPRLFSDVRLFDQIFEHRVVDLTLDVSPADLGTESSCTLVATRRPEVFRRCAVPERLDVAGELKVNPLYRVERQHGSSGLTLTFPTPEYEEEFGECKRYLPDTVTVEADLTGRVLPQAFGTDYEDLRRRRVILDVPVGYL